MDVRLAELPPGYRIEWGSDVLTLRRADDSRVAYFSAAGATPETVYRTAEEDILGVSPVPAAMRASFLGGFEVSYAGTLLPACRNARAVAILKLLLSYPNRTVSRDFLMGWLWPAANARKARWSLNSSVHALRRFLAENLPSGRASGLIVCEEGYYGLSPDLRLTSDVDEFDERYARGRNLEERGMARAVVEYEAALRLYRGDYLPADLYEDWTMIERERLLDAYVYMLDRLCGYYIETGDQQRGIETCYRLLEKDPCHEESHRRLIACYARLGMRERASRQFEVCARALKSRYGTDPSPDTHAALRNVLTL